MIAVLVFFTVIDEFMTVERWNNGYKNWLEMRKNHTNLIFRLSLLFILIIIHFCFVLWDLNKSESDDWIVSCLPWNFIYNGKCELSRFFPLAKLKVYSHDSHIETERSDLEIGSYTLQSRLPHRSLNWFESWWFTSLGH